MSKPGPRTTCRYTDQFKATAVRLSQLPGVAVGDVAASLYTIRYRVHFPSKADIFAFIRLQEQHPVRLLC